MGETLGYTSPANGFGGMLFRNANVGVFAANVAPHLAAELGDAALRIAIVGSGGVAEPWSVAALLEAEGIAKYRIDAYDNSQWRLPQQEDDTPIYASVRGFQGGELMTCPPPIKVWEHFEIATDKNSRNTILLLPALREKITYQWHDIAAQPLPKPDNGYDAVIVNTLLQHYHFDAEQLVRNIVLGMRHDGVLVCNDSGMFNKADTPVTPIPVRVSRYLKNRREAGTADTLQFYRYADAARSPCVYDARGEHGDLGIGLRGAIARQEQAIAGDEGVLVSVEAAFKAIEYAVADIKEAIGTTDRPALSELLVPVYAAADAARAAQGSLWFGASKLQSYRDSI